MIILIPEPLRGMNTLDRSSAIFQRETTFEFCYKKRKHSAKGSSLKGKNLCFGKQILCFKSTLYRQRRQNIFTELPPFAGISFPFYNPPDGKLEASKAELPES